MTVAAGVRCTDGLIICAGTERTEGNSKSQRRKIWGVGNYLLLTGAGSTSHMKMAFDKLAEALKDNRPKNAHDARSHVERLVRAIHKEHIFPFYKAGHQSAPYLDFWLITAIRCEDGDLALIKTESTSATLVDEYESVGTGKDVFNYWARHFFTGSLNMDMVSYFSLFMMREAKDAASGVGGSSFVYKMPKDAAGERMLHTIWDDKEILAGFPVAFVRLLLLATDFTIPDDAINSTLSAFASQLQRFREELRNSLRPMDPAEIQKLIKDSTSSPSVPEPPPGQSGSAVQEKGARRERRRP